MIKAEQVEEAVDHQSGYFAPEAVTHGPGLTERRRNGNDNIPKQQGRPHRRAGIGREGIFSSPRPCV